MFLRLGLASDRDLMGEYVNGRAFKLPAEKTVIAAPAPLPFAS
jgi:hypothetical protein